MKMDGDIRVATDAKYKSLYNTLKRLNVVEDSHNLFHLCACLGYSRGQRIEITRKDRDDRFWSKTITPSEWVCYYSMVLQESGFDYQKIRDDKEVILIIEEYANSGMKILIDEFLHDYFSKGSTKNDPRIDPSIGKELPKNMLNYVFDLIPADD